MEGVQDDVDSALRTLLARPDVNPDRIVVFGQSLGGAIAIYNIAHSPYRRHIRGLAVESAFASYRGIAREKLAAFWLTWPLQYPLSWLVSDRYSPAGAVADISPIPLLIIQGDQRSHRAGRARQAPVCAGKGTEAAMDRAGGRAHPGISVPGLPRSIRALAETGPFRATRGGILKNAGLLWRSPETACALRYTHAVIAERPTRMSINRRTDPSRGQ